MSEFIEDSTEKIGSDYEQIDNEAEKIPEIISGKKKSKGERGPDKNKRKFNPNSLKNLIQYQNIPLEKPNDSNLWFWIIIVIVIVVIAIILGWKIYEWWKKKQEEKGKIS